MSPGPLRSESIDPREPDPTPFGIGDCDDCGALDVPIVAMNEEEFGWCAECVPADWEVR